MLHLAASQYSAASVMLCHQNTKDLIAPTLEAYTSVLWSCGHNSVIMRVLDCVWTGVKCYYILGVFCVLLQQGLWQWEHVLRLFLSIHCLLSSLWGWADDYQIKGDGVQKKQPLAIQLCHSTTQRSLTARVNASHRATNPKQSPQQRHLTFSCGAAGIYMILHKWRWENVKILDEELSKFPPLT